MKRMRYRQLEQVRRQKKALERHLSAADVEIRRLKAERQDDIAVIAFLRRQLELTKGQSG